VVWVLGTRCPDHSHKTVVICGEIRNARIQQDNEGFYDRHYAMLHALDYDEPGSCALC
jgi:hypothetical protein